MIHNFKLDGEQGNGVCFECDNCNPLKCSWIDKNELVPHSLTYRGKIYFCPNHIHNGEGIKDYEDYVMDAYVRRLQEIEALKRKNRKLTSMVEQSRRTYTEFKKFIETFKGGRRYED